MKALLEKLCPVHEETHLLGTRWSKLLISATFSGLGTLVDGNFGDVSENKEAQMVAMRCIKTRIDIGHATSLPFALAQGKNIIKLFCFRGVIK